ncbi:MAG TPA: molybdopterin-dependent oxidoreductase [Polyangia bacterium]|nr:molybdopterin-dependent oxidoreductase [Polyangia bacterium]
MTDTSSDRVAHRICPFCEATCGLDVGLAGAAPVTVRGRPGDVFSAGYICPKAHALKDLHEDPDRLRHPLVRRAGRLVEASWDEAYAEIARRLPPLLEEHGRHAAAIYFGNPNAHKIGLALYGRYLTKALGTPNVFSASTLDQLPKQLAAGWMFGGWLSIAVPDIERCDFLLMLGANPLVSNGSMWTVPDFRGKLRALQERGGRLVVVDPRRSETARRADRHIFIRPGGDVFLLLGLAQVLAADPETERRLRQGPLAEHLAGLEALLTALSPFPPERVAAAAGVSPDVIRELARDLAGAERAAVYGRIGTTTQRFGTTASWLVDVLNILTGNLDRPGGAMFPRAPAFASNTMGGGGRGRGIVTGRWRSRVRGAPEVMGELPAVCLAEEIETPGPGQVRALFTVAGNPVLSAPNGARLDRALARLDLMVSMDIYLNETSRRADVILPGLSPLEESHYDVIFPQLACRNAARYSPAALPPPPGHPAEWEILLTLTAIAEGAEGRGLPVDAAALDDALFGREVAALVGAERAPLVLQALAARRGPERRLDFALRGGPYGDLFGFKPDGLSLAKLEAAPDGIDLGPLAPRLPEILRTPSGRIELAPAPLLADLERVAAALEEPAAPLVLIGRRDLRSNNSWMHNLPSLAKGPPRCTVFVHPQDAAAHGLTQGGRARIVRDEHSVEALVELSEDMMPGVISLPHGWGHDLDGIRLGIAAARPGANINQLADEGVMEPLSGTAVLSGVPVRLLGVA